MVAVLRHERVKTFVEEGCIFAVALESAAGPAVSAPSRARDERPGPSRNYERPDHREKRY